ncbi:MAG TPA: hypothetical protein VGO53_16495 [Steroidobacteraceae bacterium]|jgi:hypothetical protein|nr:hypothetical protein [Steroidobacteraceae bacterium]
MRAPDKSGGEVSVWRVPVKPSLFCIDAWLVRWPGLHIVNRDWMLTLVSLREFVGFPRPVLQYPNATHELLSRSVLAGSEPDPDIASSIVVYPDAEVFGQLGPCTDGQAIAFMGTCVDKVIRGALTPDRDYRRHWAIACRHFNERLSSGR